MVAATHLVVDGRRGILGRRRGIRRRPDRRRIVDQLGGKAIALVSDAGTPLISDPGYKLVRAAREAGHAVHTVPGPCAAIAGLTLAGLPTDRFAFTVFFDPEEAPVNHDIFGPEFTFTGEMIAGKITIGPPIGVPLLSEVATPTP